MKAALSLASFALAAACASPPDLEGVYVPEGSERARPESRGSNESVSFWKGGSCSFTEEVDEGAVIVERSIPCKYRLHGHFVSVEVNIEGPGYERNGVHQGYLAGDHGTVTLFGRTWTKSKEKPN